MRSRWSESESWKGGLKVGIDKGESREIARAALMTPLCIDHEFQEVAVWISHVNAGASSPAAALAFDWAFNELALARPNWHKRFGRAVPHKTQVPARGFAARARNVNVLSCQCAGR